MTKVQTINLLTGSVSVIKNFMGRPYWFVIKTPLGRYVVVETPTIAGNKWLEINGKDIFDSIDELNESLSMENRNVRNKAGKI